MGKTITRRMIDFHELGADAAYIVNLKSARVRRRDIKNHLDSNFKNIHYTGSHTNVHFIEAIEGSNIKTDKIHFNNMIREGIIKNSFVDLGGLFTANILACSLSHKKALETFLKSDNETALILEDDVRLSEQFYKEYAKGNFRKFVKEAFKVPDWEVIYYSKQWDWIPTKEKYSEYAYNPIKHLPCYANAAYVVNRKSAAKLLKTWLPIYMAADTYVESHHDVGVSYTHSWFNQYRAEIEQGLKHQIHSAINNIVPGASQPTDEASHYSRMTSSEVINNDKNEGKYDNTQAAVRGEEPFHKYVKNTNIPGNIPVHKVTWEDVKFPDGYYGLNWTRIWFQQ